MYTDYYNLREKPFAVEPDPRFLVLMEGHREALATMVYAIEQQEGWSLLIGEPGVGKTTLIMALLREVGERVQAAVITNPKLEPLDFLNQLALELGLEGPFTSKGPFLVALGQLIQRCRSQGKLILIVVDEAQDLSVEMLEELRLLGNLDASSPRVLNIFLVGQAEVIRVMKRAGAKALMQRLHRNYALKPMTREETFDYVRQRLLVAGAQREIFDEGALEAIYQVSRGIPRLINSLCDDALLLGFSRDLIQLDRELVLAAAAEDPSLDWPPAELAQEPPPRAPAAKRPTPPAPAAAKPSELDTALAQALDLPMAGEEEPAKAATRLAPRTRPAPVQPAEAHPPARKPGLLSRMAAGLSKDAPGSLFKRILVLVLVLAFFWGGYHLVKKNWRRIVPSRWASPQILIPEAPVVPGPAKGGQDQERPDWGPLAPPAPPRPSSGDGGHG